MSQLFALSHSVSVSPLLPTILSPSLPLFSFSTVLQRVDEQLASREQQNNASVQRVKERLGLLHQQMMDLRDALNQAVNNTAKAAEVNQVSQETLEDAKVRSCGRWLTVRGGPGEFALTESFLLQRRMEELQRRESEAAEQLQMAEDDVAQVNDLLSALQDSKEVSDGDMMTHSSAHMHTGTNGSALSRNMNVWLLSWTELEHRWPRRCRT